MGKGESAGYHHFSPFPMITKAVFLGIVKGLCGKGLTQLTTHWKKGHASTILTFSHNIFYPSKAK